VVPALPDADLQVIVDFEFERGLLYVGVRNIGQAPALGVSTTFDKPFRGLGGRREMNGLGLFRRIEFLAPGREVRTLLDSSAAYFGRDEPTMLTATVAYRTPGGERRKHAITHDLSIFRDLAYVPEGETDA
jgi:hypothetical protein